MKRREIDKIKFKRTEKTLLLHYKQLNETGKWDKFTLETKDAPDPSFIAALDSLSPHVVKMCEAEEDWKDLSVRVSGVSLSHTGGILGAVITAQITLLNSQSPLNINTPHRPSEPYSEGGSDEYCLNEDVIEAIEYLIEEAEGYLSGKRAQQSFEFTEEAAEKMRDEGLIDSEEEIAENDSLFEQARLLVIQHQKVSISMLQRSLKIGYARAGRIFNQLCAAEIIDSESNVLKEADDE